MVAEDGAAQLLKVMDTPEYYGDDVEEDLLASLAKLTYHLRRGKDEELRPFFYRWEEALRRVRDHHVELPDKFLGFLLVNAASMSEADIKSMMSFNRGSILTKDVKEFLRKNETKLLTKDVGIDKEKKTKATSSAAIHHIEPDSYDAEDEEIYAVEEALHDLRGGPDGDGDGGDESEGILEEHEAAEILSTMLHQKKTFAQSMKLKRARETARGFTNWKGGPKGKGKGRSSVDELKAVTRCGICKKVGHWHKECPERGTTKDKHANKEVHYMQKAHEEDFDEASFCGMLEITEGKAENELETEFVGGGRTSNL